MSAKVAVCGSGYWGRNLVRNFHELGALKTVCDRDADALREAAEKYPGIQVTGAFQEVLDDPEISGVVVATPAVTHHALASAALDAGKDVFVEKPLALEVADGEDLVARAEKNGRILMVGHILDYHPAVHALRALVEAGSLGKIQYVYSNRLNLGKVRREENILWSFAPHDISLITALVGRSPESVSASGGNYLQPHIADVTVTSLSFSGGVRGHIFVSWLHPMKEQRLVVVGSNGMAVFDDQQPREKKLRVYDHTIDWIDHQPVPTRADARFIEVEDAEPMKRECQDFLDRIADRGRPLSDGRNGLEVLRVLDAAQRSLEAGGASVSPLAASAPAGIGSKVRIHPTAVDNGATVGDGTSIWHYSHIMPGARIGERCSFGQNVYVASDVVLGDNVKVQNNVSIYDGVVIEDDVFCGPSMVFTNVSIPRSHHPRREAYEQTVVRQGATLGANSTIVCGTTVGRYSFVGAGAVVTKDIPPFALVVGNPARVRGWRCICGDSIPFAEVEQGDEAGVGCDECGRSYSRRARLVTLEETN